LTTLTLKAPLSPESQEKLSKLVNHKHDKSLTKEGSEARAGNPLEAQNPSLSPSPEKVSCTREKIVDQEKARENFEAAKAWVVQTFPKAFDFKNPKPLKIGIQKDLVSLEAPFSRTQRRNVLNAYIHGSRYLISIVDGHWRYNLNGDPVEEISQEHKDHARKCIEDNKNKRGRNRRPYNNNNAVNLKD
jgi:ProP effector